MARLLKAGLAAGAGLNGESSRKRRFVSLLITTTIWGGSVAFFPAMALGQQQTRSQAVQFNIPSQPLSSAVNAFIRTSGWQVGFTSDSVAGKRSTSVNGAMTPQQALQAILAGTGIGVRFSGRNTATLVASLAPSGEDNSNITADGSTLLETITVVGQGNSTLMPAHAGGQVARGGNLGILGVTDIMDAPFSQTSYTEKFLKDQQAQNLTDALALDSSVRSQIPAAGINEGFAIRGINDEAAGGKTILTNGMVGLAPNYRIPIELYERVELLRGPSAFLYGSPSLLSSGGTVNLVTKRATDDPINSITVGYLSKAQFGTHVDFGRRFGNEKEFGIRANGILRDGEFNVSHADRSIGSASLSIDYNKDNLRSSLDFIYNRQVDSGESCGGLFFFSPSIQIPSALDSSKPSCLAKGGKYETTDYSAMFQAEYDVNDDLTVWSKAGYGYHTYDDYFASRGVIDIDGNSSTSFGSRSIYSEEIIGETGVRGRFNTGFIQHKISLSGTYYNSDYGYAAWASGLSGPTQNIYSPIVIDIPEMPRSGHIPKTRDTNITSIAISDTLSILDERISLTVGGRYQKMKENIYDESTGEFDYGYNVEKFTPAITIIAKPLDKLSVYASYIEGLSSGYVVQTQNAANFGEVFAPQVTKQYEAGLKWALEDITATVSLFQIEQPTLIGSPPIGGETGVTYGYDGLTRIRGLELSVFGEVSTGLRVLGGVTLMDGVQVKTASGTNDGKSSPGVPKYQINFGTEWDTPWFEGLTLTSKIIHTSSQYVSTDNTREIPAWTRVDVGARYETKLGDREVSVRANVDNIFNKSYWESTYYGLFVSQSAPRTYRLSATVKF